MKATVALVLLVAIWLPRWASSQTSLDVFPSTHICIGDWHYRLGYPAEAFARGAQPLFELRVDNDGVAFGELRAGRSLDAYSRRGAWGHSNVYRIYMSSERHGGFRDVHFVGFRDEMLFRYIEQGRIVKRVIEGSCHPRQ